MIKRMRSEAHLPRWSVVLATIAGFFAVTFLVYNALLWNKFVAWDDTFLIAANTAIRGLTFTNVKTAFTTFDPELYVPLTIVSYMIDYAIGGLNPVVYHMHNLLLHTLSALLVCWLTLRLSRCRWLALAVGLLFAVHPLNTEAVAWARGRKDVLSSFFFLASLISYHYGMHGKLREPHSSSQAEWSFARSTLYLFSLGLFLLGLLSKVSVISLPIVLVLIDMKEGRLISKKTLMEKAPFFVVALVFGIVALLGKSGIPKTFSLVERSLMAAKGTSFALTKLLLPLHLSAVYPYHRSITVVSPDFFIPLIVVTVFVVLTLIAWKRLKEAAFGMSFFLVALVPSFFNFYRNFDVFFASDRYAYLPSIGLLYAAATVSVWIAARCKLPARGPVIALVIGGITLPYAALARQQANIWRNSETLFTHVLSIYPDATAASVNLGVVLRESDRVDEALAVFRQGLRMRPTVSLRINLAMTLLRLKKVDEATVEIGDVLKEDPRNAEAYAALASILGESGKSGEAIRAYRKAMELNPYYTAVYNNLGVLLMEAKDFTGAEQQFRHALSLQPNFPDAQFNLATVLKQRQRTDEAIAAFERFLVLDPLSLDGRSELAGLYLIKGNPLQAFFLIKQALGMDRSHAQSRALLKYMMDQGMVGAR